MSDYYLILGVEPDVKTETIQERFRFLANAFHPDRYSSLKQKKLAEEEFKKINEAYQVLSDPHKRADYDLKRKSIFNHSRTNDTDIRRKTQEAARQKAQEEQRKKSEEAARQRTQRETAKQEEQRKRSRQWIEANQTKQQGALLRGVDLRNGSLENANFEDADLRDANLNGPRLYFAKLARADLTNSKLIYAWLCAPFINATRASDATKVILRDADLNHARLSDVNFTDAILENANLIKSVMDNVNLTRANLKGANLMKASLWQANFTDTILTGSNFRNTDLKNTNFTGAILNNTDFEGAIYYEDTIWPRGFDPKNAGAILYDIYYRQRQTKATQKERAQEEQQQEIDKAKEALRKLPPHFPAAYYRKLNSFLGLLSDFTCSTTGNKTVGVNPTECSTIELIGSEDCFTELKLSVDYIHENNFIWGSYVVELIRLFLDQFFEEANDWHKSQFVLDKSSLSDIQSEKNFGNCIISFRSRHSKGIHELSFKRI